MMLPKTTSKERVGERETPDITRKDVDDVSMTKGPGKASYADVVRGKMIE